MSNVTLPDPIKVAFMRRVAALPVTDDMIERGLIAYLNYRALRVSPTGHVRGNMRECIEEILTAALGGVEDGDN